MAPCMAAIALLALSSMSAADWTQWRGPGRDGAAPDVEPPEAWPSSLTKVWSLAVGEGHSSPVVQKDRVYLHTREGDEEVVRAVELAGGTAVWRQAWKVPYTTNPAAREHGKGPKSTPVVAGDRLYTLGISGVLACLDTAGGRVVWKKEFDSRFKATSPLFGMAASPILEGGLLVAHVGGHHEGELTAFDPASGATRWSLEGDGPGYASAIVTDLGGRRQIITQSDQRVLGVAAADGRLLWSLPFTTPYDQNAVTSLVARDLVVVSGLEQGVKALALERREDRIVPREVWARPDLSFYLSSPVLAGGRLFGFVSQKRGHLVSLDAGTGATVWEGPGSAGESAALVALGRTAQAVLALTDDAELLVLAPAAPSFAPVARYRVAESPTWAHPVVTPRGILVKDRTTLALWTWKAAEKRAPATPR